VTARGVVALALALAGCGDASSGAAGGGEVELPLRERPAEVTEITLKALGVT
jgi:hypothetical protein